MYNFSFSFSKIKIKLKLKMAEGGFDFSLEFVRKKQT